MLHFRTSGWSGGLFDGCVKIAVVWGEATGGPVLNLKNWCSSLARSAFSLYVSLHLLSLFLDLNILVFSFSFRWWSGRNVLNSERNKQVSNPAMLVLIQYQQQHIDITNIWIDPPLTQLSGGHNNKKDSLKVTLHMGGDLVRCIMSLHKLSFLQCVCVWV